jgi:hypothetical protein
LYEIACPHAEITVDLGLQELGEVAGALDEERMAPLRPPELTRVETIRTPVSASRNAADVEDHAHGTQCLPDEPAELVRRSS